MTCEELRAAFDASEDHDERVVLYQKMVSQGCADLPDNPEDPQGSGGGGHSDPDHPHQ